MPAVGREARGDVLGEADRRRAGEGDRVAVVEHDQLAQPQVAGQRAGFGLHAFDHVAVAREHIGVVVDDLVAGPVVAHGQVGFGQRHADRIGDALAEWARGRLDPLGQMAFRVPRSQAAPLAEALDLLQRQVIAGQVEQRVEQHRPVARGQDEAVAVRPRRVRRVVAQEAGPEDVGHRRRAHGEARMAGVGMLDGVHGQEADGVDRQVIEARLRHARSSP